MMDTKLLKPREDYSKLPDAYVIFITENDVIGAGLPLYHINRWIEETHELFGDGSHILYVNGAYRSDESLIGKLMHDFRCTQPEDMNFPILADRARYFKESEGGQEIMCKMMEDMRNEAIHQDRVNNAMKMLNDGLPYEIVSKYCSLTIEEVASLDGKKSA